MSENNNDEIIDVVNDPTDVITPIENNIQPQMQQVMPDGKQKKEKTGLIIGIIIGVIVVILGICTFIYFSSNPKLVLSNNITKLYNNLLKSNESNETLNNILNNNEVGLDGNFTLNIEDKTGTIGDISNLKFNYKYNENKNDKKSLINFTSSINNEDFINLDGMLKDNKIYYTIKDVMDKYYYIDQEFISLFSSTENEDTEYILNIIKDSVIDNINNDSFKQSKEEIEINDKNMKVKKISLEITEQLVNKIVNDTIDNIKKDSKAIEILSKNLEMEKDEITNILDELKDGLKNIDSTESEKVYYNMYVKGLNETIKHEIVVGDISIEYSDYNDVKDFSIMSSGIETFNIKFDGKETGKITGSLIVYTISGDYTKDKINLNVKAIDDSFEAKLTFENKEEVVTENEEYKFDAKMSATILTSGEEMFNIDLLFDGTFKNSLSLKDIDVSNSKNIEEITEEEQNSIQEKLQNIPAIKSLMESANNLTSSDDYYLQDEDYEYDDEYSF